MVNSYSASKNATWTQNQFDAFVSLAYNTGNNFKSVMDSIRKGANPYTAFTTIIKVNGKKNLGLYRRRMDEADIFSKGIYHRTYRNW